jgi:hypothetical protein
LAAEERTLLLLARGQLAPEVRRDARESLGRALAWPRVVEQARDHGVLPLVTRNLKNLGWPGVPARVRAELEAAAARNAARSALLVRALVRVLRSFGEAGLPVIPLKGMALAESLYGDVTLRVCSDIDVLVPRPAVAQALRLLIADGWRQGEAEVRPADIPILLESDIEYSFVSNSNSMPLLLELHWDIAWRWRRDSAAVDDLWAEARPQTLWGVEAYALSREWEILYLAVHAAHHRWASLKWLVDVHEACIAGPVSWDRLVEKANRFGWGRMLALSLSACHALFSTPIPADFAPRRLPRWVRLFPESPRPNRLWDEALFAARLLDGWWDRLRYLARLAFVPTIRERRSLPLPFSMRFLYYALRPIRLAGRWTTRSLRGASGTP